MQIVILIRTCDPACVDTKAFASVDLARTYCFENFGIEFTDWEAYLIQPDPASKMKYNDDPVSNCGWKAKRRDDTFYIHFEKLIED